MNSFSSVDLPITSLEEFSLLFPAPTVTQLRVQPALSWAFLPCSFVFFLDVTQSLSSSFTTMLIIPLGPSKYSGNEESYSRKCGGE
jgi:hypothetical protein